MILALDLDGTLISCAPRQSAVLRAALARRNLSTDLDEVWRLKRSGASTEGALREHGFPVDHAQAIARDWVSMVEMPAWLALDSVLPTVRDTLSKMRPHARLHLLTARAQPHWAPLQLRMLGLADMFDGVTVVPPAHAVSAKATALRRLSPAGFFGDSESDAQAAKSAAVPFFAVSTGQRTADFLADAGIRDVFDSLAAAWAGFQAFVDLENRPSSTLDVLTK